MPEYKSRFSLAGPQSDTAVSGSCQFRFDDATFTLVPDRGSSLALDLGDFDWVKAEDYQVEAGIYSGDRLTLTHLGKIYTECCDKLIAAWRARLIYALLLSDLPLLDTFRGFLDTSGGAFRASRQSLPAVPGSCEIRCYQGGIAVLPDTAAPFHVRMADMDEISFDSEAWQVRLSTRRGPLAFGKLAKRTELFRETLREAFRKFHEQSANCLHELFPFVPPAAFLKLEAAWREGAVVSRGALDSIDPRLWPAWLERAVPGKHRAYAEHLASLSDPALVHACFKRVRPEDAGGDEEAEAVEPDESGETAEAAGTAGAEAEPPGDDTEPDAGFIFSFLYPVVAEGRPRNLVAQEVTSAGGRATYWFRLFDDAEFTKLAPEALHAQTPAAVDELNEGLALLNFRREPIYLSEAAIHASERYRRYAVAIRRLPGLRAVRSRFTARSIHSSVASWKKQVEKTIQNSK